MIISWLHRFKKHMGAELIGFISFLVLWQLLHLLLGTHAVPAPLATLSYLLTNSDKLLLHAGASSGRVLLAAVISLLIAVPLGILIGVNKWCSRILSPLLYFIYPIPKVAFLPVFMLLFGLGNFSKITLMTFIIVFQLVLSVRDGVLQIPDTYFQVMRGMRASTVQQYRYLILPAIVPYIFSGLRISIGISLATLFFSENYATTYGIGYWIMSAWSRMNYVEMFGGILVMGFIGLLLFKLIDRLQAWCMPWQKPTAE